jgi:anti-sigma factor RsiW
MKQHFSEADLLETYYMRPGESMPVMMHLADCDECAARYERLAGKLQSLRSCAHDEKPETFWARQRLSVMRRIDARRSPRVRQYAAAAALVVALGGLATWQSIDKPTPEGVIATPAVSAPLDTAAATTLDESPWASEELDDYSSIVAWESWVENGDES